jgi:hypothetical protein
MPRTGVYPLTHPYRGKPDYQFWRRVVSGRAAEAVDPVVDPGWRIARGHRIATAGSCFAQHISRRLVEDGYAYLVTEAKPAFDFSGSDQFGVFSARYGNVYTVRQLRQLFDRAYGMFRPATAAWRRVDGRFVDPFRPNIKPEGFASLDELTADRTEHLAAVCEMFETCDVFVFTLGLTEAWISTAEGSVFPLAPGVVSAEDTGVAFANFGVGEMYDDLSRFVADLRGVNPEVRIILTVSPVALAATFEAQHVLTATTYSKAALRVVAEEASRALPRVSYFPSYEMITGPHARGRFWADDLREVRPEGVTYVMNAFAAHFLADVASDTAEGASTKRTPAAEQIDMQAREIERLSGIVCDEDLIEAGV